MKADRRTWRGAHARALAALYHGRDQAVGLEGGYGRWRWAWRRPRPAEASVQSRSSALRRAASAREKRGESMRVSDAVDDLVRLVHLACAVAASETSNPDGDSRGAARARSVPADSMPRSMPFIVCAVTMARRATCAPDKPGSRREVLQHHAVDETHVDAPGAQGRLHVLAQGMHQLAQGQADILAGLGNRHRFTYWTTSLRIRSMGPLR